MPIGFGSVLLGSWLPGIELIPISHRTIMLWGGLHNTITLRLALLLPFELEGWLNVQCAAYGVILFTLIAHAPTIEPLLLCLKINSIELQS